MKRICILLIFILNYISLYAQQTNITRGFTYSNLIVEQANGKIDFDEPTDGAIVFGSNEGGDFVGISIGKEIMYQGYIISKDISKQGKGFYILYVFNSYYNGLTIPIQFLEIYADLEDKVPSSFFLIVLNRFSHKPVRYNTFYGIKLSNKQLK